MIKKSGFTLAEVLTTLMVIGVVAAMTIPTLMNSTNDQQLKVAYKKALSVLGQGVQLMTAKEEQCRVQNSNELASCFAQKVISGSVNGNVVTTSDGMQYAFVYDTAGASSQTRTLEEICGDIGEAEGSGFKIRYDGTNGKCAVLVDVNGKTKGTKGITGFDGTIGLSLGSGAKSDQFPILLTGSGVRPMYYSGYASSSGYYHNKGWEYMYGDATP